MKISVVIPAHNEESSLPATLSAVLAQDYPDFEIIVANNASVDRTRSIAESYGVQVVDESRRGTQWAREAGRRVAKGELIASLDADCQPQPTWLRQAAKYFDDPKVVALTGPYEYFDGPPLFRSLALWTQKNIYFIINHLFQFFGLGAVLIGGNCLMRASALAKVGGYNTAITFYGDDTDTAKRLARVGRVLFVRNLVVRTSARRFRAQGTWRLSLTYFYHFFKVIFS